MNRTRGKRQIRGEKGNKAKVRRDDMKKTRIPEKSRPIQQRHKYEGKDS